MWCAKKLKGKHDKNGEENVDIIPPLKGKVKDYSARGKMIPKLMFISSDLFILFGLRNSILVNLLCCQILLVSKRTCRRKFSTVTEQEFKDEGYEEIIIPYSPLRQNRFYDWPPEPRVSQVVNEQYMRNRFTDRSRESNTTSTLTGNAKSLGPAGEKNDSGLRRRSPTLKATS
mmetsp:Transcript_9106/g.12985  ORF Transcript_9106/g.12985 Transcript_9106/m.12985 type:complete len:173 (+) Transcript_9106:945-1463(+)